MGKGLVPALIAYLDTHAVVWLAESRLDKFSPRVLSLLETADLLVSPMVLLELEYLYELKRVTLTSRDIQRKVEHELGVRICTLPFPAIAEAALDEKWTRDPFDRMIVAHAKANGFTCLVSGNEMIRTHYPRAIW